MYINPVFRFLYLNMNYHVEHHIFPTVPYYHLPALHREIKAYLPPPRPSMFAAYREVFQALRQLRRDPAVGTPRRRFAGRSLRSQSPISVHKRPTTSGRRSGPMSSGWTTGPRLDDVGLDGPTLAP